MSNSKLVTVRVPASSRNYDSLREGKKIKKITIHHMAGVMSAESCGRLFQNPTRQTSSHYGIGNDGKIGQYVDEKDTAWTDGNWESNLISVTIETSNSKTGGEWKVGRKALKSLIKLVADIAYRNNLGTLVKGKNLTWHSMYMATSCPGPYLKGKMDYIASEANKINSKRVKLSYTVGTYKCLYNLNVRTGAGKSYRVKKVSELTLGGQKSSLYSERDAKALYKKGTSFTALKILKAKDKSIWAKTPSGYVCIKDSKNVYCKKAV